MDYLTMNGQQFYNMVVNASNKLEENKEFVNSLNVFPVPDGDTGTNMSMTFKAAVLEIENISGNNIGEISKKLAKGALMGARGNSGVILSQIFRGIAKGLENKSQVNSAEFANSLLEGSKSAYKAVMRPTEGTILTIIRSSGECAIKSNSTDICALMKEVCEYSEDILNKTPDMLPVLKKAKVVDAGGMGLLIIFKGMYEALLQNINFEINKSVTENTKKASPEFIMQEKIKYGYCTEFFILTEDTNVEEFRDTLAPHGDSIIVVSGEGLIKVHIHTNDPGFVLSKAVKIGELSKIKIDNMREQHRHILEDEYPIDDVSHNKDSLSHNNNDQSPQKYAFISVATGEGINNIFKDLGVDYVIEGGQTMNPSTQDILDCINKINAENIFVFPNNKNIIMSASQAAELAQKNVVVIPTKSIPQGITAITAFNIEDDLNSNIGEMEKAIAKVSTGQVTYAVRDTEMDGKVISKGDILGLVESKINEVGKDAYEVCEKIIYNMFKEDTELITILYGNGCNPDKVNKLIETLEEKYPEIDIQCYEGKQPLYFFIVSLE
jgi:uncharacterized protein